jgi:hypothetical protein
MHHGRGRHEDWATFNSQSVPAEWQSLRENETISDNLPEAMEYPSDPGFEATGRANGREQGAAERPCDVEVEAMTTLRHNDAMSSDYDVLSSAPCVPNLYRYKQVAEKATRDVQKSAQFREARSATHQHYGN